MPTVSFIIVNYNTCDLLRKCITSIFTHTRGLSFEIIVVDNASSDGSTRMVKALFPDVRLIENSENTGFGPANNLGAGICAGDYLFLLNSDARLVCDTAAALVEFMRKRPGAGVCGPGVLMENGMPQPRICGFLPSLRRIVNDSLGLSRLFPGTSAFQGLHMKAPYPRVARVEWISGVCMLFVKKAFDQVNGFNEEIFLYSEDIDICKRLLEKGWYIYHLDDFHVVHTGGASSKTRPERIRNAVLQQRHMLRVASKDMSSLEFKTAKIVLAAGLVIRLLAGEAERMGLVPGRRDGLLFETALARLRDLKRCDLV